MHTWTEIELGPEERVGEPLITECHGDILLHFSIHAADSDPTITGTLEIDRCTAAQARALADGFAKYAERMEASAPDACPNCKGAGRFDDIECWRCRGTGKRQAAEKPCPACNGTGYGGSKTVYTCPSCMGTGKIAAQPAYHGAGVPFAGGVARVATHQDDFSEATR